MDVFETQLTADERLPPDEARFNKIYHAKTIHVVAAEQKSRNTTNA